jgi:hypothetical protein
LLNLSGMIRLAQRGGLHESPASLEQCPRASRRGKGYNIGVGKIHWLRTSASSL